MTMSSGAESLADVAGDRHAVHEGRRQCGEILQIWVRTMPRARQMVSRLPPWRLTTIRLLRRWSLYTEEVFGSSSLLTFILFWTLGYNIVYLF